MEITKTKTQKLTISAIVIALYVVVMVVTQSFAFGAVQIRLATALYALSYIFPFLVLPLGLSNLLSNMLLGGLGIFDIVGGTIVNLLRIGFDSDYTIINTDSMIINNPFFFEITLLLILKLSISTSHNFMLVQCIESIIQPT